MGATIKDIAALCGVSEGTVDRALNNRYGISEKTKAKVLEAAQSLHYRPNNAARALATGSTMTISIVCFELHNNFFPQLIDSIERQAKENGYFINLILTHMDQAKERQGLDYISAHGVDGVILFPIGKGEEYIRYLKGLRKPIVTVYNYLSNVFSYVGVDNRKAFFDAVTFLRNRGYERIIFATPQIDVQDSIDNNTYSLKMRLMGYCDGVMENQLESIIAQGRNWAVISALYYASQKDGKRTAVLCSNDSYAFSMMNALIEHNIRIPEDMGVMGFDHLQNAGLAHPQLTTIGYSIEEMGVRLFECLLRHMTGETRCERYMMPYSIIEGETV